MIIFGAGLSGCIACIMNPNARVFEANSDPISHQAVLRFRTDNVSKITGIPFKKVRVLKTIWMNGKEYNPAPRLANLYSEKILGNISNRSIYNIDPVDRYVAPNNFHERLIDLCESRISFGYEIYEIKSLPTIDDIIISTLPMPVLAKIIGISLNVIFEFHNIFVSRYVIKNCDVFQTIYYPSPETSIYRATITGDNLIIESMDDIQDFMIAEIIDSFGIHQDLIPIKENYKQKYGKIKEIDNNIRKSFIHMATVKHKIYSLGRFAIWKNILLDDVANDLNVIRRLQNEGAYSHLLEPQR